MQPYNFQLLESYLDNELPIAERRALEQSLSKQPEMQAELQALRASAHAVQYYGLSQDVATIQQQFLASRQQTVKPAPVRHIFRPAMRVAASILILLAAFGTYKYSTVNSDSVSSGYYMPYELDRTRGEANTAALETAFNKQDWQTVINLNNGIENDNKSLFLAGSAHMELNQPAEAINTFTKVINNNSRTGQDYFQDEAEYYLALAYIKNNQPSNAISLLKSIRNNPEHAYHQKANDISMLDLRILSWKSGK